MMAAIREGSRVNRSDDTVTVLLQHWRRGDPAALDALLPMVYDTLRSMAAARMRAQPGQVTLQPTALVHEALLRLLGRDADVGDRAHFLAMMALKMRAVLVDHARQRLAEKRGGGMLHALTLSHAERGAGPEAEFDVLALHDALHKLEAEDARAARAVELMYFGGMTREEIATATALSLSTVDRDLRFAKAWLNQALA